MCVRVIVFCVRVCVWCVCVCAVWFFKSPVQMATWGGLRPDVAMPACWLCQRRAFNGIVGIPVPTAPPLFPGKVGLVFGRSGAVFVALSGAA